MVVDWTKELADMDGKPVLDEEQKPITLGSLAIRALLTAAQNTPAEEKLKRYNAAHKIHDGKDLTIEDAAMIKKVTGEFLTPLPMALIWQALEGSRDRVEKSQKSA